MRMWKPPKIWKDETVFLLAGGPTLEGQMKDGLPEKLNGRRVVGVNNALHLQGLIDIDAIWFGDSKWFFWHLDKLKSFPGLKATCCDKLVGSFKWIKGFSRGKPQGIETKEGYVAWNRSSGSSGINFVYNLGAKRVVLLGFDMRVIGGKKNWLGHPRERTKLDPYNNFKEPYKKIMRDAKELGFEIVNASPDSALKEYKVPEVKLEDVL